MISALNAASFRENPTTAVVNVLSVKPDRWQHVENKHQLQQQRRAADEPDIEPGRATHRGMTGQPRQRQDQSQKQANHHGKRGDFEREQSASQ